MLVRIYPSSDIIIPEPSAEEVVVPLLKIELTGNSTVIPTTEGNTLAATEIPVSEYSFRETKSVLTPLEVLDELILVLEGCLPIRLFLILGTPKQVPTTSAAPKTPETKGTATVFPNPDLFSFLDFAVNSVTGL